MIQCAGRLNAALVMVAALFGVTSPAAESDEPAPGVSLELAKARALNISRLRYELALSIPDALAQPVTGASVLRFHLADPTKPLVIDFDAAAAPEATVAVNGAAVPTRAINGHLVIPAAPLRQGENTVHIDFRAGDAPLNRSRDFLTPGSCLRMRIRRCHVSTNPISRADGPSRWSTLRSGSRWPMAPSWTGKGRGQRWSPRGCPGDRFGKYLRTVRGENPNAQLDQWFVRDALFAPQHVLPRHPANQPA
jgi:hypothetical protein